MKEKIVFILNPIRSQRTYQNNEQNLGVLLNSCLSISESGKVDLRLILDLGGPAHIHENWIMEKLIAIRKNAEVVISPAIVSNPYAPDIVEDRRYLQQLGKNGIKTLDEYEYVIKSIEEGYHIIRWSYYQ